MRRAVGTVAAVLLAAATVLPVAPAVASGGFCQGGGVNVEVDFHQLGGGAVTACDPSGGGDTARSIFPAAGFTLTPASNMQGFFVCQVNGKPADQNCEQGDAYWGLFWAKPGATSWTYSSLGADSLKVPEGGSVAFSWQGSTARTPPGIAPPKQSTATPSKTATPKPSHRSSAPPRTTTSGAASPNPAATSTSGPTKVPRRHASATASTSATPLATPEASSSPSTTVAAGLTAPQAPGASSGSPVGLVAGLGVLAVILASTAVVVARRRS